MEGILQRQGCYLHILCAPFHYTMVYLCRKLKIRQYVRSLTSAIRYARHFSLYRVKPQDAAAA